MEIKSVYRGARMSAFKVREVTREIQGLPASEALDLIAFTPKKAALLVGKTLKSAIANAENNNELRVETLVVKEATVGEGPTMKRMKSRARGSSSQIRKRTSHIRIILTDEIEIPERRSNARKKSGKAGASRPARPAASAAAPAPVEAPAPVVAETPVSAAPSRPAPKLPKRPVQEVEAEPANNKDEGPGETAAAPKLSSDEDVTKA